MRWASPWRPSSSTGQTPSHRRRIESVPVVVVAVDVFVAEHSDLAVEGAIFLKWKNLLDLGEF